MMATMHRTYSGTPRTHYLSRSNIDLREKPVSRLVIMQARFQQKQLQEKEEKLLRLYEEQQERHERALNRVKGQSNHEAANKTVGAGKVRSLLQYRRDHGRDKSYPLDPLPLPRTQPHSPSDTQKPSRTRSLGTRKHQRHPPRPSRQNLLYFGGSHQDLRFSDELDYGQSFQVINDQLLYDNPPQRTDSDDTDDDFYIKSFNNKRQFYENHLTGTSEDNLSDSHSQKVFHKLPNVGLNGSLRMSQKVESPNKYKTFVSGKSTLKAPQKSGLPTRQTLPSNGSSKPGLISPPARKNVSVPPARPRLGLDSPTSPVRTPPDTYINNLKNLRLDSPPHGLLNNGSNDRNINGMIGNSKRSNGIVSPPPRSVNGSTTRKVVSPPSRLSKPQPVSPPTVAPVPASRTTVPRPVSSSSASSGTVRKATPARNLAVPAGLSSCKICGRNFATDRLSKHESICQKSTTKKRKVFDPVKHRVQGTEAEKYVLSGMSTKNAKLAEKSTKTNKSNWRKKHEDFIKSIRAAKEVQDHLKKGGKLSDLPPPPPSDYSDYVQCPHCQRKFNETAAERHIPKCVNMQHNKTRPAPSVRSSSTFRKK